MLRRPPGVPPDHNLDGVAGWLVLNGRLEPKVARPSALLVATARCLSEIRLPQETVFTSPREFAVCSPSMATTIGVSCTSQFAYVAAIKDGDLIEAELERLQLPALEQSKRLAIFVEDTARQLNALNASGLAGLKAEQTPPGANRNISHVYDRTVLETLIRLLWIT